LVETSTKFLPLRTFVRLELRLGSRLEGVRVTEGAGSDGEVDDDDGFVCLEEEEGLAWEEEGFDLEEEAAATAAADIEDPGSFGRLPVLGESGLVGSLLVSTLIPVGSAALLDFGALSLRTGAVLCCESGDIALLAPALIACGLQCT
jgi:hypothetical protein